MTQMLAGILSERPFVARRTVGWSDCDPAAIVFAGRFHQYALWAWDLFNATHLQVWPDDVTTPVKAASLVHTAPLRPRDAFDVRVTPTAMRHSTFNIRVEAYTGQTAIFAADLTLICVRLLTWRKTAIPVAVGQALSNWL